MLDQDPDVHRLHGACRAGLLRTIGPDVLAGGVGRPRLRRWPALRMLRAACSSARVVVVARSVGSAIPPADMVQAGDLSRRLAVVAGVPHTRKPVI